MQTANTYQTPAAPISAAVAEPHIVTANTYFWRPAGTADGRRANEERRQTEVAAWLRSLGFEVVRSGDVVRGSRGEIAVEFYYRESTANVYKSFAVTRDGRRSNITLLRKLG